jgi:excisionase family DNA binding protein
MRARPMLLDIREACSALRISRAKFYEEMRDGKIESVSIGTRRLIPADALDDYIERLRGGAS